MENLKTILDSIKEHTTREWYQSIPNKSIARGQVTMKSGKNEIVWIVNREYSGFGDSVLQPAGESSVLQGVRGLFSTGNRRTI